MNKEEVLKYVVNKIKKLKDNEETTIKEIIDNSEYNLTDPELLQICNDIVSKLKDEYIKLNFDVYNKEDFPYNIPFKRLNIISIVIGERLRNISLDKGNIHKRIAELRVVGNSCEIKTALEFTIETNNKENAKLVTSIPFTIKKDNLKELNNLISLIFSTEDYVYNEKHYNIHGCDNKMFDYHDVHINGKQFEILNNDNNLIKLKELIKLNKIEDIINKEYESIIKNTD